MNDMEITAFLNMDPPTATAQMKKVAVVGGKPRFYEPAGVRAAKREIIGHLITVRPVAPLNGALELTVKWLFPAGKSHKPGEWRTTRPDTDNLEKMLKDCMTQTGFWKDDAQVVREVVEKQWTGAPAGIYITVKELQ